MAQTTGCATFQLIPEHPPLFLDSLSLFLDIRDHATTENSADMWDGDNDKERKKERGKKKKIINRWHD
jgi:hypothetical protein